MHGVGALLPSARQGQLSIVNATKEIVACAIVTKRKLILHVMYFPMGFTITNISL